MSLSINGTASVAEVLERELARAAIVRAIVMGRTLHLVIRRYYVLLRAALSLPPPHRATDEPAGSLLEQNPRGSLRRTAAGDELARLRDVDPGARQDH
jgi:hypothetical protein